jgi:tetratricopeptide (TPR) repeat protein
MKKQLLLAGFLLCVAAGNAQIKMPAPSPTQTIKQDFALGSIELTYSRPAMKGRKVFGDLVPFNKLWRTGANGATIIKFTDAVEINGKRIDTGSYALYTVPGTEDWEIILNKGTKNWGTDGYKESEDVLKFKVPVEKMKTRLESFTMQFANIMPESCELHIMWEKTAVRIPINATIKGRIKTQIDQALLGEKKPYWQAAQFYNEYEKNGNKALEYIKKAVEENPKAYYMWLYKAKIENGLGDKKAAMVSSKKSLELSREAKNDDYIKMNIELQKKL